jgi:hypothetical protein
MQTVESRPEIVVTPAAVLFAAESGHLVAEQMIESHLDRIFGDDWGPGYDYHRDEQSIDVFGAAPLPEHVDALVAIGFDVVRIHAHGVGSIACSCTSHWSRH